MAVNGSLTSYLKCDSILDHHVGKKSVFTNQFKGFLLFSRIKMLLAQIERYRVSGNDEQKIKEEILLH